MKTRTCGAMIVLGGLVAMSPLGQHRCLAGHRGAPKLPGAAAKTLRQKFPGARIGDVEIERREHGFRIYEAEIRQNGREMDVQVTDDGTLVRIKAPISAKELPAAVTRTVETLAGVKAKVRESEKVTTFVRSDHGEITALPQPVVTYEVAFRSAGKGKREVRISSTGKILATPDQENDGEEEGHSWWRFWDKNDDDDGEKAQNSDDDDDNEVEHGDKNHHDEHDGQQDGDNEDEEDDD